MSNSYKNNVRFFPTHFMAALLVVFVGNFVSSLYAGSIIFDGVITKVDSSEKKKSIKDEHGNKKKVPYTQITLFMRAANSPYTSVGAHSRILTTAEGKLGGIVVKPIEIFESYYIDDIPVSREEVLPLLVPGARITTFENRAHFYYLRVASRTAGNQLGFMTDFTTKDGQPTLTLRRPQLPSHKGGFFPPDKDSLNKGARMMKDGYIHLHPGFYPPLASEIPLAEDAIIQIGDEKKPATEPALTPWIKEMEPFQFEDITLPPIETMNGTASRGELTNQNAELYKRAGAYFAGRTPVVVQAARSKMRVEIIDNGGFGRWDLITGRPFSRWGKQMQGMFAGILLSDVKLEIKKLNIQRYTDRERKGENIQDVPAMKVFLLGGGRPQDGEKFGKTIYRGLHGNAKHPEYMIDGFNAGMGDSDWRGIRPGLWIVAHMRRSRPFADSVHIESEAPAGWGVIQAIHSPKGATQALSVEVEAPEIPNVSPSGAQRLTIDADAEYYHNGQLLSGDQQKELFVAGAAIRVYPARPQTILINKR